MCYLSYYNYTDEDRRTSVTASSEDSNFPASNLDDNFQRAKPWRTAGCFVITSANKVLIFRDDAMTNLTATLTEGTYNSDEEFFAEIKDRMEDVGGYTYTISRDSDTHLITIASSHSTFQLRWDHASTTIEDVLGFSNGASDTGSTTYTADFIRLHTEEYLIYDFGSAVDPQAFFLALKKDVPIGLSGSATIQLMGNSSNVFGSPAVTITLDYAEEVISHINLDGIHSGPLRYWKFKVVDRDNANGYLEFGLIFLGLILDIDDGRVQFPLSISGFDASIVEQSVSGQLIADNRGCGDQISLRWFNVTKNDKEIIDSHYKEHQLQRPFFVNLDPDEVYSTEGYMIRLVQYTTPPQFSLQRPNLFDANMSLREQL